MKTVNINNNLSVSQLADMGGMFNDCTSLKSVDLSSLDFKDSSNTVNMSDVFARCSKLESVKMPVNVNVSEIESIFNACTALAEITGLETWDVSQVTNFEDCFFNNFALKTCNISGWDVSSGTDFDYMFRNCTSLTLDCSNWNVKADASHTDFNVDTNKNILTNITLPEAWQTTTN